MYCRTSAQISRTCQAAAAIAFLVAACVGGTPAFARLVLYLPFDTVNGSTTPDLAGSRDGTLIGNGVSLDNNIAVQLPVGGNALRFAGSDDYVETIFPGILGTKPRSFSFWIARDGNDEGAVLSYGRNSTDEKWVMRRNDNGSNGTDGAFRTEVSGGYQIGDTVIPGTGTWQHVVMTWDPDATPDIEDAKFYVNGALETNTGDNPQTVNTSGTNPLQIGNDRFDNARDWNGMIDDVAVFDRVLGLGEIQALADGSASPADYLTAPPPTVVFQTGFEYAGGNPSLGGNDASDLNGADGQIGAFEGAVPDGQGLGDPNLFSFKNTSDDNTGDQTLAVDRGLESGSFDAVFTEPIALGGADVTFELATIRTQTNSREKDYSIIGLDEDDNESFHLLINTASGEERLTVLTNDYGTAIEDFLTIFGDDADEDLDNAGATDSLQAQEIANIQLLLQDDGYQILFARTGGNRAYTTELLDFNGSAESLSRIRFAFAGSDDVTVSSGFHIDNLSARGYVDTGIAIIPEPSTLFIWSLLAALGIGCGWYRRKR